MKFVPLPLQGAYCIELSPHRDERGEFTRLFCARELEEIGHTKKIVQINHSMNRTKGTIRGLHFQFPPSPEIKIVTCMSGRVFDVIVDIRKNSPTFLSWYGQELSQATRRMLYIPAGFAHGFQTLEESTELLYLHTEFFSSSNEGGLRYDDERVGIQWPLEATEVSARDRSLHKLTEEFKGISR